MARADQTDLITCVIAALVAVVPDLARAPIGSLLTTQLTTEQRALVLDVLDRMLRERST